MLFITLLFAVILNEQIAIIKSNTPPPHRIYDTRSDIEKVIMNMNNQIFQNNDHRCHGADDDHPEHLHWHLQRRRLAQWWRPQVWCGLRSAQVSPSCVSTDIWWHVPPPGGIIRPTPSLLTPGSSLQEHPTSSPWRKEGWTGGSCNLWLGFYLIRQVRVWWEWFRRFISFQTSNVHKPQGRERSTSKVNPSFAKIHFLKIFKPLTA